MSQDTAQIRKVQDKEGTQFFPITHVDAVIDENGDAVSTLLAGKQDTLVSGTNIKTINNESLLGSGNISVSGGGGGTVTSVAMTVPTGLSISGSPITSSGTLAVSLATGYSIPTTSKQDSWDAKGTYSKPSGGIPKTDLASAVQTSLGKADTALQSYTETDPVFTASAAAGIATTDISAWNAKLSGVTFNGAAATVTDGVAAITATIPAAPGTLQTNLTTAQTASASEALSGSIKLHKIAKTGTYSDLIGTPAIPTKVSELTNDAGYTTNTGTVTRVDVGTSQYSPASGIVSLPAYPTTLPASDVSAWAKAANKPSYTLDEVSDGSTRSLANYLPLSGGTLSSINQRILTINHTGDANNAYFSIRFSNIEKAGLGYDTSAGLWMKNIVSASGAFINIDDSGIFKYKNLYTIYHSGNFVAGTDYQTPIAANTYAPYNSYGYLPLNGGTLSSSAIYPLTLNSTNINNAAGIRFSVSNTLCGGIYVTNNHELRFYDESSAYGIYHSGNFIAGTNYQAPIPANTYAPYNSSGYLPLSAGQSSPLTDALYINAASVYNLYVNNKSSGATVSGIRFQTGGTTNGALLIDSNHTLSFHDNTDYRSIYHSGNFIAGTNYQTPIPANTYAPYNANGYLPLNGGNIKGSLYVHSPNVNGFGVYGNGGAYLGFGKYEGTTATRYGMISMTAKDASLNRVTDGYSSYMIWDNGNQNGSDIRLKSDIKSLDSEYAKNIINKARPVAFKWKEEAKKLDEKNCGEDIGLIAQEVQEYFPKCVGKYYEEYLSVEYKKFIPILIKVVQEQQKEINELKTRLSKLEEKF